MDRTAQNKLRIQPSAESVVWAAGEGGVMTHMVFGLTVSARGTLIALSEARIHFKDEGPHHLVLKRSLDGGESWQATQYIEENRNGECWANPTGVSDSATGKLFVFYSLNSHNASSRVFFKSSADDGLTWSERTEVTSLLQSHNPYGWTLFLPGPGHGIQLQDGRLMLQYWGRLTVELPPEERLYGNGVLYSDDHGAVWQAGGVVPLDALAGNNEARLAERVNGELYLNARANGLNHRVISVSKDRGMTWSEPRLDTAFPKRQPCDSGLIRWQGESGSLGPVWLYSTIRSKRYEPDNALELYASYDEGLSWSEGAVLFDGKCNYSDLTVLPDRSVAVLFGAGAYASARSFAEEVRLVRFRLDQ